MSNSVTTAKLMTAYAGGSCVYSYVFRQICRNGAIMPHALQWRRILTGFPGTSDRSRFDRTNAVTSVARDTTDPEQRWNLEELGGGIAARLIPHPPADDRGRSFAKDSSKSENSDTGQPRHSALETYVVTSSRSARMFVAELLHNSGRCRGATPPRAASPR